MQKAVGQAAEELLEELDELLELDEEPEPDDDFDPEPDPEEPEPEPEPEELLEPEESDDDDDDAAVFAGDVGAVLLDEEPRLSFR